MAPQGLVFAFIGPPVDQDTARQLIAEYARTRPIDHGGLVVYDPQGTFISQQPYGYDWFELGGPWYTTKRTKPRHPATITEDYLRGKLRSEPGRFTFPHGSAMYDRFPTAHRARQAGVSWGVIEAALWGDRFKEPETTATPTPASRGMIGGAVILVGLIIVVTIAFFWSSRRTT